MNTIYGVLATIGVAMVLVHLFRLRSTLRRGAERTRNRRQFLEREKERDRRACLAAARSLDSETVPRQGFALAECSVPAPADTRRRRDALEGLRRAAASTAFDPDLPGA